MIYHARKNGFPAIDATHDVLIIHQNHDYSHLPGGQPHYKHPETDENIRLAGGRPMTRFTLLDTDKRLVDGKILPQKLNRARLWRRIEVLAAAGAGIETAVECPVAAEKNIQVRADFMSVLAGINPAQPKEIMRKGQNPAKFVKEVAKPERITVAVLNYIPFLSGFYAEALDVLKVSLESMRVDAGLPFDLMIFDNGSCPEVRDYLVAEKEAGRIQYLVLSEKNMGKGGAWNVILAGAPGEIIAYSDFDILYYPGWLSRSVELLETFPRVGMVTARPFRTNPEFHTSTREWAKQNAALEEGQFIPWETFWEFNRSLGQDEAENRKVYSETNDWKIGDRAKQP